MNADLDDLSQVGYRPNALMEFDADDGAGLTITPSFKQRSSKSASKGKGRAVVAAAEADDDSVISRHDDDGDEAAGPAVVFRSKNKDRKSSALGASSSSKASTPSGRLLQNRSSSKLSLSFGGDEGSEDVESSDSAVKRERKLKRPAPQSNLSSFNAAIPSPGADRGANQTAARCVVSRPRG